MLLHVRMPHKRRRQQVNAQSTVLDKSPRLNKLLRRDEDEHRFRTSLKCGLSTFDSTLLAFLDGSYPLLHLGLQRLRRRGKSSIFFLRSSEGWTHFLLCIWLCGYSEVQKFFE